MNGACQPLKVFKTQKFRYNKFKRMVSLKRLIWCESQETQLVQRPQGEKRAKRDCLMCNNTHQRKEMAYF